MNRKAPRAASAVQDGAVLLALAWYEGETAARRGAAQASDVEVMMVISGRETCDFKGVATGHAQAEVRTLGSHAGRRAGE